MKKILLAFSVLLFFSSSSYGQAIRNFTSDPVKFIEEMNSFLTETNKKEGEALMEKFAEVWKQGKFSAAQQEAIYKTANGMLRKHMKAFPDFKNYLSTLISFINSSQSAESFNGWQQSLDKLILMPSKHFATYINVCNNLFSGNSLYLSASTRWYSDNNNYKFEFDSLPKIIFPQMNLTCVSKGDSAVIKNTHGFYYPTRSAFWGEGGNVNWERGGWDAKTVFAQFAHFVIDVTGSDYTADSVLYTNSAYFSQPLLGKYSDKILANASPENASYPRFVSYNTSFKIKNIVPDIDYDGGFSMEGNKMIGSGNKEADAHLTFYNGKKSFLIAASKNFVIRKDKITSGHASVIMLMDTDTVYHPGLTLKYIVQDRELALIRGEDGGSMSPYYDSYHDVDMYFDALYWKIDNPTMDLKMLSGAGENEALFQSSNYFRMNKFLQLQGINSVHPLFTLKQFVQKNNSKIIYTDELAKYMRIAPSEVRHLFIDLSNQGFVIYDGVDDKALLKDRLYYYLLASTGKTDYDVIQFESIIKNQPNASINLLNYEITLRGVKEIVLSDSQNVIIYPREQEVHLKKNRDFNFAGRVHAGRFDFYGKQFDFDYQNFKINLENVDSLRLKVESDSLTDSEGKKRLVYVKSVLQKINGDLLIDYLGNKSGLKEYSQYPIFNSKKDSYVYYSKPEIQEGVYTQDRFYFHLDPFTIDSLDNFTREGLRFDGELVSAGIFETFRDTLKLQPDISLGLVRETSAEGWPAYGGKGKVTSTLALSNNGLHGNGTLEYVSSTTHSDDYLFLPDSMNSFVTDFTSKKETLAGTEFPDVKANYVYEHWEPNKDVMHVNMRKDTMSMYEGQSLLAGNLQLRPTGLTGNGQMSFAKSLLESHLFRYKSDVFDADTSDFRLTAENTSAVAFSTNDVKAHIDFAKRFGDFKANSGGNYVKFDLNQYICFIDQFKWFMDQEELEMTSSGSDTTSSGLSLTGSEFISVEPTQDSLRFRAPFAKYSLRDYLIKAEKVALIQTADASIIPDSGKVVVERYAKMQTLTNSVIVANNITKYHSIYNANVDILGRKKYEGSGDYDYVDENKIKHHLHFDKVGVDTTFQTYAD